MVEGIESRGEKKPDDGDKDDAPGHVTLRVPWEKQPEPKGSPGLKGEKQASRNSSLAALFDNRLAERESRPGPLMRVAADRSELPAGFLAPLRLSRFPPGKDQGLGAIEGSRLRSMRHHPVLPMPKCRQ